LPGATYQHAAEAAVMYTLERIARPAQTEQRPVEWQHKKPTVNDSGEIVGYSTWTNGKGLDWWPHRPLYAAPIAQTEQRPVAWVEVKDRHEGPYEFHGIELLDSGKHNLYAAPIAQPYPNRVAPHIDQFAEGVFVWYDEAALPGGAEPTLQAAQQAMAAYGESLNGPDNGGVCQTCGGDLVGDGYSTIRHCENLDVIGEGYEPDAGPLHCQEPTNG